MTVEWRADVLGEGFECVDLDLGTDDEGPVVATLVRSLPRRLSWWRRLWRDHRDLEHVDVLYVHGWSDYFFQTELARFWTDRGARFHALDLRKYGRSLREGQTAGYIEDLAIYHEEIDQAIRIIIGDTLQRDPDRRFILFGHSTGGLVLSLWCADHPGVADALVLNSPWLEFQLSSRGRKVIAPVINLSSRLAPHEVGPQLDFGYYARAQREVGPADDVARVNPEWRPERAHAVHGRWMSAILAGHDRVARGLELDVPTCVLLSERSASPLRWSETLTAADTVLNVEAVAYAATHLGASVTIERVSDALHDVFLSRDDVRAEAYERLDRWLRGWAIATRRPRDPLARPAAKSDVRAALPSEESHATG